MFCRECGAPLTDQARRCGACGAEAPVTTHTAYVAPVVTNQPHVVSGAGKPDSYLLWSILTTVCCCPLFGIIGIIYAAQVDSKWAAGDSAGAIRAANNARLWTLIGVGVGVLLNVIQIVIALAATGMSIQVQ